MIAKARASTNLPFSGSASAGIEERAARRARREERRDRRQRAQNVVRAKQMHDARLGYIESAVFVVGAARGSTIARAGIKLQPTAGVPDGIPGTGPRLSIPQSCRGNRWFSATTLGVSTPSNSTLPSISWQTHRSADVPSPLVVACYAPDFVEGAAPFRFAAPFVAGFPLEGAVPVGAGCGLPPLGNCLRS